jgi:hypothetical protein
VAESFSKLPSELNRWESSHTARCGRVGPFRSGCPGSERFPRRRLAVAAEKFRSGELAKSNSEQVSLIRDGLEPLGAEIGNPAEAHQMLGRRGNDKVPIPKWSPA